MVLCFFVALKENQTDNLIHIEGSLKHRDTHDPCHQRLIDTYCLERINTHYPPPSSCPVVCWEGTFCFIGAIEKRAACLGKPDEALHQVAFCWSDTSKGKGITSILMAETYILREIGKPPIVVNPSQSTCTLVCRAAML